mgnify:CR=1 FL=1
MSDYKIHDVDSAPEKSKPLLENSQKGFGMIPNLHGVMAESPAVLDAYQKLTGLFQQTSFTKTEQHVIWLAINYTNNCHYCMPAHTGLAYMDDVDESIVGALRDGKPIPDEKLEALRVFATAMVGKRGVVSESDVAAFHDAGYNQQHVLEVILGVSHKVLSNYINHVAQTPVDEAFSKFAWEKDQAA